eukprot:11707307-Alexandrium_andersonii.AAC.1
MQEGLSLPRQAVRACDSVVDASTQAYLVVSRQVDTPGSSSPTTCNKRSHGACCAQRAGHLHCAGA